MRPGDLYVGLPGASTHGARFAAQASAAGALAVLTDATGAALARDAGVPVVVVDDPRSLLWVAGLLALGVALYLAQRLTAGRAGTPTGEGV